MMTNLRDRLGTTGGVAAIAALIALAAIAYTVVNRTAGTSPAERFSRNDRAAVERIVHDYIMAHPEIIPEAMSGMQSREVTKLLASNRKEIETPFAGAYAGARDGDVVLVEFFDYACPYCRAGHADVVKLLAADKRLKVVYRDFPVLSEASGEAALASLSAAQQNRYAAFHDRMFDQPGKVTRERTVATVRAAGLNERRTAADMTSPALKAEIKKNLELGRALGLTGTPSYIVGDKILSGAVGLDALRSAVAAVRAKAARDAAG